MAALYGRRGGESSVERDLRQAGATAEQITAVLAQQQAEDDIVIHPDNVTAIELLAALKTQWRTEALSTMNKAVIRYTGLDYSAVMPTAQLMGLDVSAADFQRLRAAEDTALKYRNNL